ncbi:AraC-like DNA-binding protein [Mucilaginibacter frigoritolerans]|uniref:AraC-like DNA-binding protein n=1 Tax=Mucilaginibacter frigoritolerans TaxID=652788 RepID=A0A562UFV4_9SPHI|nr:helix-turn-helix domain-containing protein [Mucilaginibacter frigoritolerans]TWJ04684.1 AraC-like DNA-binding protein [Mucilaginibacter frigoritolerans]
MENVLKLSNENCICSSKLTYKNITEVNNNFTLHVNFNGNENFVLNKKKLRLSPHTFLAINPGTLYSDIIDSGSPVQKLSISFGKGFMDDFKTSFLKKDSSFPDNYGNSLPSHNLTFNETIFPLLGDLKYNIEHLIVLIRSNCKDELLLNEFLYHILLNYYTLLQKDMLFVEESLKDLQFVTRNEIYRRLSLAKEYLYSNFDQKISIHELSKYSCMSATHLIRSFRQAYHTTPHQFLINIRLKHAEFLLKNTSYPINKIVNTVGLDSPSTFIKLFKIRHKITPLKYRNSHYGIN